MIGVVAVRASMPLDAADGVAQIDAADQDLEPAPARTARTSASNWSC